MTVAGLVGRSVRRGEAVAMVNGDGGDELRSVVCARGEQRRGWGPGGERRGAGGEGECVALGVGSRSGGSRRWLGSMPARGGHTPSPTGARRKATGSPGGLGQRAGPTIVAGKAHVVLSFSLSFLSVFSILFTLF